MGKALVIVESPAKAKTINKYLGSDYVVKSSVGHIRDLPTSGSASKKSADSTATKGAKKPKKDERSALVNRMGVDPWHDWNAHYEVLPGKELERRSACQRYLCYGPDPTVGGKS